MPKGPEGQWRPAELAPSQCTCAGSPTGEIEETYDPPQADSGNAIASRRASVAGKDRAAALTPEQRSEIARQWCQGSLDPFAV